MPALSFRLWLREFLPFQVKHQEPPSVVQPLREGARNRVLASPLIHAILFTALYRDYFQKIKKGESKEVKLENKLLPGKGHDFDKQ